MKNKKLTEAYENVSKLTAGNFVGSASEFAHNLGRALNSLEVLLSAPLEEKDILESIKRDLNQYFNAALEIEHELKEKSKDEPTYP